MKGNDYRERNGQRDQSFWKKWWSPGRIDLSREKCPYFGPYIDFEGMEKEGLLCISPIEPLVATHLCLKHSGKNTTLASKADRFQTDGLNLANLSDREKETDLHTSDTVIRTIQNARFLSTNVNGTCLSDGAILNTSRFNVW